MKKRSFLFASGLALALLLTACGGKTNSSSSSSSAESKSEEPHSSVVSSSSSKESSTTPNSSSVQPISSSERPSSGPQSSQQQSTGSQQSTSGQQSSESQESTSSQSSGSSEQEAAAYYVRINGVDLPLSPDNEYLVENQTAQYRATLGNVAKGVSIAILNSEKQALSENFNAETGNNNVNLQEGNYVIHNDASDAFVLVKTWQGGWTNFYVSGYVADQVVGQAFKVVGTMNDWNYANSEIAFVDATDSEQVAKHYYTTQQKAVFQVNKGDEFKLVDESSNYIGGEILESTRFFNVVHSEDASNNNIKANFNGEATLYLKTYSDDTKGVAINFTAVIPEQCYVIYDSQEIVLAKQPANVTPNGCLAVYTGTTTYNVVKDKPIAFVDEDKQPFTGTCIPDSTDNNVVEKDGWYFIHNDKENVVFMLFFYESGWLKFYVGGYEASAETYTVIDVPTWVSNDDAVVFAWTWSTSDTGSWRAAHFIDAYNGTEISFVAPSDLEGFVLVRCAAGTTTPNWDATGNSEGRIYNKTGNQICSTDTFDYFCPDWEEYNP